MLYQVLVSNLNCRDQNTHEIVSVFQKGDTIEVSNIISGTNYKQAMLKDGTYVHAGFDMLPYIEKIQKKKKKEDKE